MSSHYLLASTVSDERLAVSLIEALFYVKSQFSLSALKILSLVLYGLTIMYSGVDLFVLIVLIMC